MDLPTTSYDEVPYPSHAFPASNPDHLYTMAKLFKLDTLLPDNASILELGCASGGNVIPLAVQMPNARIVGVDLSGRQIAEGQARIAQLGLKNIQLLAQDFQSIDGAFGDFDYILCHGVFSWVPEAAQQRILEICHERLTPNGVAYVSYNAYPGWFMRGMIRQMMLHHVAKITDPRQKIKQARALLAFLVDSTESQKTPYAAILKTELDALAKQPDAYLLHEHLEENNRPMFFYQFVEMANAHKLQFMSEAHLPNMITDNLPPKAAEALTKLTSDIHQRSQYTDFVTNRTFRQSLLCRQGQALDRQLDPARIESGLFAGSYRLLDPAQMNDLSTATEVAFETMNKQVIRTSGVGFKALLFTLIEAWPQSLSIAEIFTKVQVKLSAVSVGGAQPPLPTTREMAGLLLQLVSRGDINVRMLPDRFTTVLSERPAVSALTRLESKGGQLLTTRKHSMFLADDVTRLIAGQLDGGKTKQNLEALLEKLAADGVISVKGPAGQAVEVGEFSAATVDKVLELLRTNAMLTG